jgi:hypothetical protein
MQVLSATSLQGGRPIAGGRAWWHFLEGGKARYRRVETDLQALLKAACELWKVGISSANLLGRDGLLQSLAGGFEDQAGQVEGNRERIADGHGFSSVG